MNQRGGIGCGTVFGACIFGMAALFALSVAIDGPPDLVVRLMLLSWSLPGLGLGGWMVHSGLRGTAASRKAMAARMERQVLSVAAANQGRVSPAMVTMAVPGVDVAAAKRQLDAMARDGYCTIDSDDDGRPYYTFPIGVRPANDPSPEEWVKQVSGADPRARMTGEESASQSTHTEA